MKTSVVVFEGNNRFSWGGGQRVTVDLMHALKGFSLYLIEVGETPEFFRRASPLALSTLRLRFPASTAEGKVSYNFNAQDFLRFPFDFIRGLVQTQKFLRANNLTAENAVLYSAAKRSHILCWLLKKVYGFTIVCHLHTLDNKQSKLFSFMNCILKTFDLILVVSEINQKHFGYPQIQIISPSVERIALAPRKLPSAKPFVVAYVGSLIKIKGVDTFLKAFDYLKNADDFEFWILGEGAQEAELKSEFASNPKIKFLGFAPNTWEIMNEHAQLLVLPSRVPESFGLVLIESAGLGIPFIASNLGSAGELSREIMMTDGVPADNPKAIAERIEDLVSSEEKYLQISGEILKRISKYSAANFNEKIKEVFKQL